MMRLFRRARRHRELYVHEDDYCQQQLLPRAAGAFADAEMRKIADFAEKHRAPGGLGWTDVYVREECPTQLRTLGITREQFAKTISPSLPPFDFVYTGYSSHRELCRNTAAWGTSERCALLADWSDDGVIANVWAEFFDAHEACVLAASKAVTALGRLRPLIYVDWAWGYTCEVSDENAFASLLRHKLKTIADNRR